jgi:hypothetical protein
VSEHHKCDTIVHQFLEVEADITVKPIIKHGRPMVSCIESDFKPSCKYERGRTNYPGNREQENCGGKCTFTVTQVICVEIPISFEVDVDVDEGIVHCGRPEFGPCPNPSKKWPCNDRRNDAGCNDPYEEHEEFESSSDEFDSSSDE